MGPMELDGTSGEEPMGPLEQAGGPRSRTIGPLKTKWGPMSKPIGTLGGQGVSLEITRRSWRPLGLLGLAGALA